MLFTEDTKTAVVNCQQNAEYLQDMVNDNATQVDRLVCSHVYRPLDLEALQARAAQRGYGGRLIMGHDLMTFDLA